MRLVSTSQDRKNSDHLSQYLTSLGIENQLEIANDSDWGSPEYGIPAYKIWVKDEDQLEQALAIVKEYFAEPDSPKYQQFKEQFQYAPPSNPETNIKKPSPVQEKKAVRPTPWSREPMGIVTLNFLIACCILFFVTQSTEPEITEPVITTLPQLPLYSSDITKRLLFDYPEAFEIIDKLVKAFGIEKLQHPQELPKEGVTLLKQFQNTPYWTGYYDEAVRYLRDPAAYKPSDAPMFEKIRQGELWRLFTPVLLHGNIFHILFNMMWLAVMGRQLEQRMGRWRYLLFIFVTGILANVIQYLSSGGSFMGFSAILCAMLSFVWVRQKYYPWEGYQLQPSTLGFIMFYLFTLLAIQLTSFYTEVAFNKSIGPPIANAAHMGGLLIGAILGRLNFFAWR